MTTHGDLYDFNIMKSVEKYVRDDTTFWGTYGSNVLFEDIKFDPTALDQWMHFTWVHFGPTIFSLSVFHVRCFSRSINDRYGKSRERMIGDVRNLLENTASGITFYDIMNNPTTLVPIQFNGEDLKLAIRFADRSVLLDAEEFGESTPLQGVHVVVLSFNAHVARPNVLW